MSGLPVTVSSQPRPRITFLAASATSLVMLSQIVCVTSFVDVCRQFWKFVTPQSLAGDAVAAGEGAGVAAAWVGVGAGEVVGPGVGVAANAAVPSTAIA